MYWQLQKLRSEASFPVSSTYRLDLPEFGFLSALMLQISGDQASDFAIDGGSWRIIDYISKVEVVLNGSTVCKDLTGALAQALAYYDQGRPALDIARGYATNTQFCNILLLFGRKLFDPDYGLDLGKYDNVELRVTNTATSSEFTSGFSLNVDGVFLRPIGERRSLGYLRSEVWREYTTSQDGWEYLELPSEHLLRRIVLQAIPAYDTTTKAANTSPFNLLYDVEHYLRTGEIVVYEGSMQDLARINAYDYGHELIVPGHAYVNADKALKWAVGYPMAHVFMPGSYTDSAETIITTLTSGQTADTVMFESGVGAGPDEGLVVGYSYHNTAVLRHDVVSDPITWLDPATYRTVLLNLHTRNSSSAANGTVRVVLDRLVRY